MENNNKNQNLSKNFIHPINEENHSIPLNKFLIFFVLTITLGGFIGFGLSKINLKNTDSAIKSISGKKTVGIQDKKTFKDSAEGILKEGGIDGEGNFHLERPGGPSQNVYLTSSTVDLSQFVGKKVRVWGETFAAEKAGWLMDVGLVEIIE